MNETIVNCANSGIHKMCDVCVLCGSVHYQLITHKYWSHILHFKCVFWHTFHWCKSHVLVL